MAAIGTADRCEIEDFAKKVEESLRYGNCRDIIYRLLSHRVTVEDTIDQLAREIGDIKKVSKKRV